MVSLRESSSWCPFILNMSGIMLSSWKDFATKSSFSIWSEYRCIRTRITSHNQIMTLKGRSLGFHVHSEHMTRNLRFRPTLSNGIRSIVGSLALFTDRPPGKGKWRTLSNLRRRRRQSVACNVFLKTTQNVQRPPKTPWTNLTLSCLMRECEKGILA